jgi:hypothetical protein
MICVNMDVWPPNKCGFDHCGGWANSSILFSDLLQPRLVNTLKALGPIVLRVGGTMEDFLVYDVPTSKKGLECPGYVCTFVFCIFPRLLGQGIYVHYLCIDCIGIASDLGLE